VLRETVYDTTFPVVGAVQESATWLSPGVASKLVGTDGGVHTGVAEASAELAELQDPLLALTT
jgi:hypothetical protein